MKKNTFWLSARFFLVFSVRQIFDVCATEVKFTLSSGGVNIDESGARPSKLRSVRLMIQDGVFKYLHGWKNKH